MGERNRAVHGLPLYRRTSHLPGARRVPNLPVTRKEEGRDERRRRLLIATRVSERPVVGYRTGMIADEAPDGYSHRVIGAVHEVTVERDSPDALARAVRHELDCCRAPRIVVDLSALADLTEGHLEALRPLTLDCDRAAVRLQPETADRMGTALEEMGVRDVITEQSPRRAGRTGLSGHHQG